MISSFIFSGFASNLFYIWDMGKGKKNGWEALWELGSEGLSGAGWEWQTYLHGDRGSLAW